jgi:hypothetical protein
MAEARYQELPARRCEREDQQQQQGIAGLPFSLSIKAVQNWTGTVYLDFQIRQARFVVQHADASVNAY